MAKINVNVKVVTLDDALDWCSVHDVHDIPEPDLTGWFGVSDDDNGGITAYFSTERAACRYRLCLINRKLNG